MSFWCKFDTCNSQSMILLLFKMHFELFKARHWWPCSMPFTAETCACAAWKLFRLTPWLGQTSQQPSSDVCKFSGSWLWTSTWSKVGLRMYFLVSLYNSSIAELQFMQYYCFDLQSKILQKKSLTSTPSAPDFSDLHQTCQSTCWNLVHSFLLAIYM